MRKVGYGQPFFVSIGVNSRTNQKQKYAETFVSQRIFEDIPEN